MSCRILPSTMAPISLESREPAGWFGASKRKRVYSPANRQRCAQSAYIHRDPNQFHPESWRQNKPCEVLTDSYQSAPRDDRRFEAFPRDPIYCDQRFVSVESRQRFEPMYQPSFPSSYQPNHAVYPVQVQQVPMQVPMQVVHQVPVQHVQHVQPVRQPVRQLQQMRPVHQMQPRSIVQVQPVHQVQPMMDPSRRSAALMDPCRRSSAMMEPVRRSSISSHHMRQSSTSSLPLLHSSTSSLPMQQSYAPTQPIQNSQSSRRYSACAQEEDDEMAELGLRLRLAAVKGEFGGAHIDDPTKSRLIRADLVSKSHMDRLMATAKV